ncbi:unnamed protein product [Paramecium sonneborni]|uniref:Uncharacterized protein n=1 Tax=Paramecium sonneborni TaxID=65129 RepID=A0A8S1RQA8_9CILI|nr:unnamed protein product [Paramecium sonneborni]
MLKLNYQSEERQTFSNLEEILKVVEIDDFGIPDINFNKKTITYQINHQRCIRLSDLKFWIVNNLVRIHLGQLLDLCLKLLQKVKFLESKSIQHNYLDQNRIWLILDQNSASPSVIYQFLSYQILFTGYQSPCYESGLKVIQATTQIKNIVKLFLEECIGNINLKKKTPQNKQQILEPIIEQCKNNQNIQEIIKSIEKILLQYRYQENIQNKSSQSLDIDDDNNYDRQKLIEQINIQIDQIIECGSKHGQLLIEKLLHYYIPIISKQLGLNSKLNLDYQNEVEKQRNILDQQEQQFKQKISDQIKILIKNSIIEYEKDFKFEITESDLNSIEKEIINSIMESQYIKYFQNTYQLHHNTKDIMQSKIQITNKFLNEEVKDKISLFYMFKILELIDNLI